MKISEVETTIKINGVLYEPVKILAEDAISTKAILQGFEPEKICGLTLTQILELKAFYLMYHEKLPNE